MARVTAGTWVAKLICFESMILMMRIQKFYVLVNLVEELGGSFGVL